MLNLAMFPPEANPRTSPQRLQFMLKKRTHRSHVSGQLSLLLCYNRAGASRATPSSSVSAIAAEVTSSETSGSQEPLPPGCERRLDGNGRTLYVDTETHVTYTSYQQLIDAQSSDVRSQNQAAVVENVRAREAQASESEDVAHHEGTDSAHVETSARTTVENSTSSVGQEALPPGWVMSRTKKGR